MNHSRSKQTRIRRLATRTQQTLLPLVAVSGGFAGLPANALELGDITVQSSLGQPLRASIAYALAPHEELSPSCVTLGFGATASGLPGIGRATLSIADGTILLTGKQPVREPMMAAMLNVDCAYTANLSREYLMFIDPAASAPESQPQLKASPAAASLPNRRDVTNNPSRTRVARVARPAVDQSPIAPADRYRVQQGDTLSQIVQRIDNRSTSLWPAVNAIFDANPDAFIDNDPNKLKAGSWLNIPASVATGAPAPAASVVQSDASPANPLDTVTENADAGSSPTEATADINTTMSDTTNDLRPVLADPAPAEAMSDNPFVDGQAPSGETVIIADTELEGPATASSSPNVTTAVINSEAETSDYSWSWLLWLAGTGVALIVTLLLFGRLFRGRPDETEVVPDVPQRRATDLDPTISPNNSGIEVITHAGYTIEDDSPTAENLTLDADLVMGTGLDDGTDMEVAQDFGFASPTELDLELPFEPQPAIPESDTGIFAIDDDETSVMESGDDDYDVSVIVDATKMPRPEEITQRDLQAVEVEAVDDIATSDSYAIDGEADFDILEQDYEDELTATQALNAEIMRAAEELAVDTADTAYEDYDITSEVTAATPLASVTELDVTAQLPTGDNDPAGVDETGIHEAATVEMPLAENDETAEMELDDGAADSKVI